MKQIYVPYRERKHPVWPDGARLAVAMYVAIEEWDPVSMVKHKHPPALSPGIIQGMEKADLAITTTVEYGYRIGIYRLMEVWDEFRVRPSLLCSALAIEKHTELFKELIAKGHRLVGHGYEQGQFIAQMSLEEQKAVIKRCIEVPERILGKRPNGWGSPGTRQSEECLEHLAHSEFKFHMGLHNDELPYFIEFEKGLRMVEIPYRIGDTGELNDYSMFGRQSTRIWPEAVKYMKSFFDARYEAAREKPALVTFGCHPYVSGRPDRTLVIKHFLRYITGFPDVWVTDFEGIAEWWSEKKVSGRH